MHSLTAESDVDTAQPRILRIGRRDNERVFRAARRHSRRVRFLRLAVPGAVVATLVAAIAISLLSNPLRMLSKMPIDIGSLVVSGSKIMMQQPRVAGFTRDNRRYDLTAQAAGQDLTKPDLVELQGIRATMEMKDQAVYETTARAGIYNSKSELLTLSENIVVTSTSGYRAMLSEAMVDIRAGKITSEKPVEVTAGAWTVNSNRMEISDSGDVMRFDRGVTVVIQPEEPAPVATSSVSTKRGVSR
jgi:lipopolysaccharide export system protein LptC